MLFCPCTGVLYGNGKTWHEQRRFTLTTLRDFGFGKESMEELIEAEAAELVGFYKRFPLEMLKLMWIIFQVSVIAKHYINKPTDVQFLFNINVLSSLWRIVAGKHLVIEKNIYTSKNKGKGSIQM